MPIESMVFEHSILKCLLGKFQDYEKYLTKSEYTIDIWYDFMKISNVK